MSWDQQVFLERLKRIVVLLAICLGTASAAAAQPLILEAQLPGTEPAGRRGYAVALSGDGQTALVGAPGEDVCVSGWHCGAAHVLVRRGTDWVEEARLNAPEHLHAEFGTSVALSYDGSIALIGAPWGDPFPGGAGYGAAYVFVRQDGIWSEAQKLVASDRSIGDFFGWSVDLSRDGSTALVGATHASCGGTIPSCGAAYVFSRIGGTWIETARLAQPDPIGTENFGRSVSLSDDGTVALVGALFSGQQYTGEAFVFAHDGAAWTLEGRFTASDAQPFEQFGMSVSLSGDGSTAIVGKQAPCSIYTSCGAYVFARNGGQWTESAKLTPPASDANSSFGMAVALSGDGRQALTGVAIDCRDPGTVCRVAYLWVEDNGHWQRLQDLIVPRRCDGRITTLSTALSENAAQAVTGVEDNCTSDPGEADLFGRAFVAAIPTASGAGLAVLALALAVLGAAMLRR